jgi:hypothetical protein
MKNITLLFLLFSVAFSSCETDFNVNADWEEVTVVFGLLDQSQDRQYIRINKAFLGNESAYVMASVSDSLNYNPDYLEVKIEKLSTSGVVLQSIILTDTIMEKEDGYFATDNNIIYVFDTDNFLNEEKEYLLTVTNKLSGKVITSKTKLIHDINLMSSFDNPVYKMGFYNQTGSFSNTTVEWNHSQNASIYQMTLYVNYTEYGQDTIEKTIQKLYPIIDFDGNTNLKQNISGEEFFNLIAFNVPKDNTVNRRINNIDLLFSAASQDLKTYISLNEPPGKVNIFS